MAIEIVDLPIKNGGSFQFVMWYVTVYQRVFSMMGFHGVWDAGIEIRIWNLAVVVIFLGLVGILYDTNGGDKHQKVGDTYFFVTVS